MLQSLLGVVCIFIFYLDPNISQNVRAGLVLYLWGKHQSEPLWTSRRLFQVDNCHLLMETLGSISQMDLCWHWEKFTVRYIWPNISYLRNIQFLLHAPKQ